VISSDFRDISKWQKNFVRKRRNIGRLSTKSTRRFIQRWLHIFCFILFGKQRWLHIFFLFIFW